VEDERRRAAVVLGSGVAERGDLADVVGAAVQGAAGPERERTEVRVALDRFDRLDQLIDVDAVADSHGRHLDSSHQ
jgi:hypothetical protein